MMLLLLGAMGLCCLVSLANWRHGIYLATILDVLRDPIRKLTPNEPAWMTQVMIPVWAAVLIGCLMQKSKIISELWKTFPRIRAGVILLFAAMLPGLFMSLLLYQNGWLVAGIGGISYVGPVAGLLIGACLASDQRHVYRFMHFYVFINSLALMGSVAEQFRWDWPALGGMAGMEWIRHIPGIQVRMISGFFRSPDIAGFHAANTLVFSVILTLPQQKRQGMQIGWLGFAAWAGFVISLAGRRKMLAIPGVFLLSYVGLFILLRRRDAGKSIRYLLLAVILLIGGLTYSLARQDDAEDRTTYFSTVITDAIPKVYGSVVGASITTLQQSGILGSGLGVASQGAQHTGIDRSRVWQEDGTSRLFKELGVIGVLFICGTGWNFVQDFRKALRFRLRDPDRSLLQVAGVAFAAGNLASFIISHQHISGDAANGLIGLLMLGGTLGHVIADRRANAVPSAVPISPGSAIPGLSRR